MVITGVSFVGTAVGGVTTVLVHAASCHGTALHVSLGDGSPSPAAAEISSANSHI